MASAMDSKPPTDRRPARSPDPRPRSLAGGAPLALLMIAGVIIGGEFGQPSVGLVVGTAVGVAIAIFIWRRGRR